MAINYSRVLTEASVEVDSATLVYLPEATQIHVTDDVLTGMMKFITDKYNALDFREIEKSAGDIAKFKYTNMIKTNTETLANIYRDSTDPGAKKFMQVTEAIDKVMHHLDVFRGDYIAQYQAGNGLVQMLYVSLVAGCLYSVGALVQLTIRFVTTDQDVDSEVLFDEIPGAIKNVHIANILAASASLKDFENLLVQYRKQPRPVMHEAVETFVVGAAIAAGVILLIPKIIVLIREIIYSIYFNRVKLAEMCQLQIDLINTNIESLSAGRGDKKVIARQRKIVDKLEKWKNRVAIKSDTVNSAVLMQKRKENDALKIDKNSPIVQSPGTFSTSDLMI